MKELQKILSRVRQAAEHYEMILPGDKIAVGLSGGKDSTVLLVALAALSGFYPVPFSVCAVTVSPGFPGQTAADYEPFVRLCDRLDVEYRVEETRIAQIVFEERKEKAPCSLCAKLRRGALCAACQDMGANRLALGHHRDDVVETFMLNLMQTGKIGCFMPVTEYPDTKLSVIRPLIYTEESDVRRLVQVMDLPVYRNPCPADGETERANMKEYLRAYDKDRRGLYRRILGALERSGLDGWHV
ncbi:MAG: tRNA 2-thiocytidine(32) synthetase TtcA [Ruminococcaceae bacterium]|nr:tRNA 2-thiocytidine(32) synthetase TtcA [Oscillospiraceae bacterium]